MDNSKKVSIWLDCDPGNDDCFAIILAGTHPKINLLGVSTCFGNTGVVQTTKNACTILDAAGIKDISVVGGAEGPICPTDKEILAEYVHGHTGIGTKLFPDPTTTPLEKNAVMHIYETVMAHKTKVKLVATGALTNYAILLKMFPDIKSQIEELVLMGGAIGFGNHTPSAEYNLFCDPEAAHIVFNSGLNVVMVPLEVTHTTLVPQRTLDAMKGIKTKFVDACLDMLNQYAESYKKFNGFDSCPLHDPCTIAYIIAPEIFDLSYIHVDVELRSEKARGRTICDLYGCDNKRENVHVATKMNVTVFWELMLEAVKTASGQSKMGDSE